MGIRSIEPGYFEQNLKFPCKIIIILQTFISIRDNCNSLPEAKRIDFVAGYHIKMISDADDCWDIRIRVNIVILIPLLVHTL